jgi:ABC-2 type transport system ATP-binding protein
MDYPLQLEGVSKTYGDKRAVRGLDLKVGQGTILGFLGPNGAGKSTSLRIALGIVAPDTGRVSLFGEPPTLKGLRRVGFLPEERGLYRKMSARETIAYFAQLKGMTGRAARARADDLLERGGLKDAALKPVSKLSKGMAQKVQILSTIAHEPDFLILDEPFSGLDPVNQIELEKLVREQHARGATIIFSTHVMEHAERLCDQLVIISGGLKRFDGTPAEALAKVSSAARVATADGKDIGPALAASGFAASEDAPRDGAAGTEPRWWTVALRPGQDAQGVLQTVMASGAQIAGFTPVEARLRDVFVQLVGEADRSDAGHASGQTGIHPEEAALPHA